MKTLKNIGLNILYIMGYRPKKQYPYPFRDEDRKLKATGVSHTYVLGKLVPHDVCKFPKDLKEWNIVKIKNTLKVA